MIKKFFLFVFLFLFSPFSIFAQNNSSTEAQVIKILEQKDITSEVDNSSQTYQKLELLITKGDNKDDTVIVENGLVPLSNPQIYRQNDRLVLTVDHDLEGNFFYTIIDYVRRDSLLLLFLIFAVLVIFIARWKGLSSLLSMSLSFVIIFKFVLPKLLTGSDPIIIGVLASLLIIPFTFYLSHGLSRKTTIAVLGTFISLVLTAFLAVIFVNLAHLSGFTSEEAGFLQAVTDNAINIKSLLISGIIIGLLGILDDITIAQSSLIVQLKQANPDIKVSRLYHQAMSVGQDHIASMVNTLILVYAGAALPLLLLFIDSSQSFTQVVNTELIADEIIRTLVASIGLVIAVPVTTLLAIFLPDRQSL